LLCHEYKLYNQRDNPSSDINDLNFEYDNNDYKHDLEFSDNDFSDFDFNIDVVDYHSGDRVYSNVYCNHDVYSDFDIHATFNHDFVSSESEFDKPRFTGNTLWIYRSKSRSSTSDRQLQPGFRVNMDHINALDDRQFWKLFHKLGATVSWELFA
jgi:hypothetical protein